MIYISYGVTKSASTFLYQLTEETFRTAGRKVARLGHPFRPIDSVENYFNFIETELLDEIETAIGGQDIVLKTHGTPPRDLAQLVASGRVMGSASIRDPREIALSMLDHGTRSRRWRSSRFSEFVTVADTLHALDLQIACFLNWAGTPGVAVFNYNDICFDSAAVVRSIAAQIGAEVDAEAVVGTFGSKTTIGQFSKGKALRYTEMDNRDQTLFLERFKALYSAYEFETEAALKIAQMQANRSFRPSGELRQSISTLRRLFRV
ncbi:hypothetical protein ASE63_16395 [Bosea sp. Root381]|uniref:hypothetical protein n=1 Tax=Bosea sp. Root381 TaxID=1736524 RepID=UPI0006F2771A|nr:hypothetical protein [Bosea sp. Root381]KRE15806.1 hypothetical protein ASE63_16395 [Bosea sp. Root381]